MSNDSRYVVPTLAASVSPGNLGKHKLSGLLGPMNQKLRVQAQQQCHRAPPDSNRGSDLVSECT